MKTFLSLVFLFLSFGLQAQHIYPEKFDNCIVEEFVFERDTSTAKIGIVQLLTLFKDSIYPDALAVVRGGLSLQILVNTQGQSCLLSVENTTNIPTAELNLKKLVDTQLHFENPQEMVSVVILMSFTDEAIELKRLGNDGVKGWHELQY